MRLIGVLLLVSGCSFQGSATPDAAAEPDGMRPGLGMFLTWDANPTLPGSVGGSSDVAVTDVTLQLERLQLVSDGAVDGRTTRSRYQLVWNAGMVPDQEAFPDAPVAEYQHIVLNMRGDVHPPYAYQITGTWRDDEDDKQFRVADTANLDLSIDCNVSLPPGGSVSVVVRVDLRDALGSINFKNLPQDGQGVYVLSNQLALLDFRGRLTRAFTIEH